MAKHDEAQYRFQPTSCALVCQNVWAIMTKQADGSWKIVNCLDKHESCFRLDCAFTTDSGQWPYPTSRDAQSSPA